MDASQVAYGFAAAAIILGLILVYALAIAAAQSTDAEESEYRKAVRFLKEEARRKERESE